MRTLSEFFQVLVPRDTCREYFISMDEFYDILFNMAEEDLCAFLNEQWNNTAEFITMNYSNLQEVCQNQTQIDTSLPDRPMAAIIIYMIMFAVAATGNVTVFSTIIQGKLYKKSRINLLMMNLAIADLMVTYILIPLEVIWRITITWRAGDIACRIMMILRMMGLYLSSFILVCISLDRYVAICHPFSSSYSKRRAKIMLVAAWSLAVVCSIPQGIVFHVDWQGNQTDYLQCVTFNAFPSENYELLYKLFCTAFLYILPLVIMIVIYSMIMWKMMVKTRDTVTASRVFYCFFSDMGNAQENETSCACRNFYCSSKRTCNGHHGNEIPFLRRSDTTIMARAKKRTLTMTILIVSAFVLCWTPYFVVSVWSWIDSESLHEKCSPIFIDLLFIFAVSNSCVNPIVYGSYTVDVKRKLRKLCSCLSSSFISQNNSHAAGNTLQSTGTLVNHHNVHHSARHTETDCL